MFHEERCPPAPPDISGRRIAPPAQRYYGKVGMKLNDDEQKSTGGVTSRGFVKGDSRINRRGRPRSFDQLRSLALQIAAENVIDAGGNTITRAEQLLRSWVKSRVPALQLAFAAYAWGKVPDKIEGVEFPKTPIKLVLRYGHELGCEPTPFDHLPPNIAREMRRRLNASTTEDGNSEAPAPGH